MKKSSSNLTGNHISGSKDNPNSTWASGNIIWWVGILFGIGSLFFALGSLEGYVFGRYSEGFEFFIGSLFFTSAAFLQYAHTVKSAPQFPEKSSGKGYEATKRWAMGIQILGALFFNISTYVALKNNLLVTSIKHQVWSPDFFGSTCFLVATSLVWFNWGYFFRNQNKISWWTATFNLLGSLAFVLSALTAYFLHKTGVPHQEILMNTETFLGAICFLVGAILLLIEYKMD